MRATVPILVAVAVTACASRGHWAQTKSPAPSFREASDECNMRVMQLPPGGVAAGYRDNAYYEACLRQQGWEWTKDPG